MDTGTIVKVFVLFYHLLSIGYLIALYHNTSQHKFIPELISNKF